MKLDYSKTLNEQRDTIENILNENKHYSLQLSQLEQENENLRKTIKNDDRTINKLANDNRLIRQQKEELIKWLEEEMKKDEKYNKNEFFESPYHKAMRKVLSKLKGD